MQPNPNGQGGNRFKYVFGICMAASSVHGATILSNAAMIGVPSYKNNANETLSRRMLTWRIAWWGAFDPSDMKSVKTGKQQQAVQLLNFTCQPAKRRLDRNRIALLLIKRAPLSRSQTSGALLVLQVSLQH